MIKCQTVQYLSDEWIEKLEAAHGLKEACTLYSVHGTTLSSLYLFFSFPPSARVI